MTYEMNNGGVSPSTSLYLRFGTGRRGLLYLFREEVRTFGSWGGVVLTF